MSDHLPECEMSGPQCAGRPSGEGHRGVMFCMHCHRRCICSALRACEQRVRTEALQQAKAREANGITWAQAYAAALDAAETEVLDIHEPFVYENRRGTYCLGCMENSGQEYPTEWPCPTVIAIRALREEQ